MSGGGHMPCELDIFGGKYSSAARGNAQLT